MYPKILGAAHSVHSCGLHSSHRKEQLFVEEKPTDYIPRRECVYCAAGTQTLNVIKTNLML
jgi:hypothetical protein